MTIIYNFKLSITEMDRCMQPNHFDLNICLYMCVFDDVIFITILGPVGVM